MCDTFIAMPPATADGSVLFGKNSDREPNEAQALAYYPGAGHSPGTGVACTYLQIPQVKRIYAVLISRPFWMWGAEMGANEKGVVIGNEAVFTRMPVDRKGGLTGMDILRLALERSQSADKALETMIQLLADHGQGGICGYKNRKFAYHNSFIIADKQSAWVLETAGHLWAALRITDSYSISNRLTIGEAIDESHPDLIAFARQKGWLKRHETFHFSRCYSDWLYTTFSASRKRRSRSLDLLNASYGNLDQQDVMQILRDHGSETYRPGGHFLQDRLCSHAANGLTRDSAQTTGSLIAHMTPQRQTYWATGTSAPCTGIFKPIWFKDRVLPDIGPEPGGTYDSGCLWWLHEELHRSVLKDYDHRMTLYRQERDELEDCFMQRAAAASAKDLWEISVKAFEEAHIKILKWIETVKNAPGVGPKENWLYRHYWSKQNRSMRAG
jgi:secernin